MIRLIQKDASVGIDEEKERYLLKLLKQKDRRLASILQRYKQNFDINVLKEEMKTFMMMEQQKMWKQTGRSSNSKVKRESNASGKGRNEDKKTGSNKKKFKTFSEALSFLKVKNQELVRMICRTEGNL